ncbi:hypothetical protein RclHR1_02920002 [Rhizophagus clarus]|uniref:Restriction of telomere capping protein 4 n=1 Tax=Rhizophagus clarus TaxID=94130 RepID=A0A2Z6R404_9GLOM|nr:hypothetical protein RclHR1_02920002 [Rhizophagus clarus]
METYENQIKYNNDGSVNVPFGRAAEWYISNVNLLKNYRLKNQSRQVTPKLVKAGILTVERVQGAVDYLAWKTINGTVKSTNRIDDILVLTSLGNELVSQIELGLAKDQQCWYWVMYCSGDGSNCQRLCGGIGKCNENCENYNLRNNLKNGNDMHHCSVRVISECRLSWLSSENPLRITIQGTHRTFYNNDTPKISRINLTYSVRDTIVLSRRAGHRTTKGIKAKLLTSFNGAPEEVINNALASQRVICDNDKLRQFVARDDKKLKDDTGPWTRLDSLVNDILKSQGFILYYQIADINHPADSPERYYQLTISDEFWLRNARDYGKICIGIDGKYDLNLPVLSIVTENNTGGGLPIAFALCNKENHHTIRLAIDAIKKNIPCDNEFCEHKWYYENLLSGNGFQRVRECQNNNWKPYILIDKHRPSKIAIQNALHKPILCWFHIMKTFSENLNKWQIPAKFKYPIALAFKIVGRSRTEETAIEMVKQYNEFVSTLPIEKTKKDKLIDDLSKNWMSAEWKLSFIDAGRISKNGTNRFPWTTNNFTERINRTIEAVYSGKQTPLTFIERMYGTKFQSNTIANHEDLNKFDFDLVTLFNTQTIEQQTKDDMVCSDKVRRLNQGRLAFLLNMVKISSDKNIFFVKKKPDDLLVSPYNNKPLHLDEEIVRRLNNMIKFLMKSLLSENIKLDQGYHICDIITGECTCWEYIWNSSLRDKCKHYHAATLFKKTQQKGHIEVVNEAKENLVHYFRNKEIVVPASIKNNIIYQGDIEDSYQEIIRLYNVQGNKIFYPLKRSSQEIKDPFWPIELNEKTKSNLGAPPKLFAKPRLSHKINLPNQSQSGNTFSIQQRKTKQIQNLKRKREDNLSSITDKRIIPFASSSTFIMPSPPHNVFQHLPELLLNDDLDLDLNLDLTSKSHNLCPYCDEILPGILPEKLKDQLQILQNKSITEEERWSFCIMHHGELNIVPLGLLKGYPEYIDFNVLPSRIIKFEKDLVEIINKNITSYYWDIASSIYKEVGYNKVKAPMMFMNRFEVFQPGYYGFNGLYIIINTLMDLFITFNNLTKEQTYPLNPVDFIYEVLVPEVTLRLIQEDRNNNITLEDARKILTDSVEFGVYMHSNEIDIDNSLF